MKLGRQLFLQSVQMAFPTLQCIQRCTQQVGITARILLRLVDEHLRRHCCRVGKESWSLRCPSISSQQDLDMFLRGGEGFWCCDKVWSLDIIICVILKQNGNLFLPLTPVSCVESFVTRC